MRFNFLSSFSAGILVATSIFGVVYLSGDQGTAKTVVKHEKVQLSDSEMKDKLVAAGYVVQTKAEHDKATGAKTANNKPAATTEKPKVVNQVVVNVTMGMTSIDVGHQLQAAKIIPNAFNFSKDIEKRGLEKSLKPGTFSINSDMSYDQIINTIFKK